MTAMGGQMRAAIPNLADGGRIELVTTAIPLLGPREVLVQIHAAAMNRADLLHQRGNYGQRAFANSTRPNIAGMEMAGSVVRVGSAVDGIAIGTAVMAMCAGAYAEYVAVDQSMILAVPANVNWSEAAALPMGLLTEFEALAILARMRVDNRVLITGATSGVGLVGVQMARALGASAVLATSRAPGSAALLETLGADAVASTRDQLVDLLSAEKIDIVVDHVGGQLLEACVSRVRKGASLVSVGRLGGRTAQVDLAALSSQRARIIGTTWRTQELSEIAAAVAALQRRVLPLLERGQIQAVIGGSITFDELASGYEELSKARTPGKIVVTFACD